MSLQRRTLEASSTSLLKSLSRSKRLMTASAIADRHTLLSLTNAMRARVLWLSSACPSATHGVDLKAGVTTASLTSRLLTACAKIVAKQSPLGLVRPALYADEQDIAAAGRTKIGSCTRS